MDKESRPDKTGKYFKAGIFWFCVLLMAVGITRYFPVKIVVSSTSGKRELPIYSVKTDKKQVALSFDAAWAVYRLRNYLL